jgi:hypothetical protein
MTPENMYAEIGSAVRQWRSLPHPVTQRLADVIKARCDLPDNRLGEAVAHQWFCAMFTPVSRHFEKITHASPKDAQRTMVWYDIDPDGTVFINSAGPFCLLCRTTDKVWKQLESLHLSQISGNVEILMHNGKGGNMRFLYSCKGKPVVDFIDVINITNIVKTSRPGKEMGGALRRAYAKMLSCDEKFWNTALDLVAKIQKADAFSARLRALQNARDALGDDPEQINQYESMADMAELLPTRQQTTRLLFNGQRTCAWRGFKVNDTIAVYIQCNGLESPVDPLIVQKDKKDGKDELKLYKDAADELPGVVSAAIDAYMANLDALSPDATVGIKGSCSLECLAIRRKIEAHMPTKPADLDSMVEDMVQGYAQENVRVLDGKPLLKIPKDKNAKRDAIAKYEKFDMVSTSMVLIETTWAHQIQEWLGTSADNSEEISVFNTPEVLDKGVAPDDDVCGQIYNWCKEASEDVLRDYFVTPKLTITHNGSGFTLVISHEDERKAFAPCNADHITDKIGQYAASVSDATAGIDWVNVVPDAVSSALEMADGGVDDDRRKRQRTKTPAPDEDKLQYDQEDEQVVKERDPPVEEDKFAIGDIVTVGNRKGIRPRKIVTRVAPNKWELQNPDGKNDPTHRDSTELTRADKTKRATFDKSAAAHAKKIADAQARERERVKKIASMRAALTASATERDRQAKAERDLQAKDALADEIGAAIAARYGVYAYHPGYRHVHKLDPACTTNEKVELQGHPAGFASSFFGLFASVSLIGPPGKVDFSDADTKYAQQKDKYTYKCNKAKGWRLYVPPWANMTAQAKEAFSKDVDTMLFEMLPLPR